MSEQKLVTHVIGSNQITRTMLHPFWTDELIARIKSGERIRPSTLETLQVHRSDEGAQRIATHVEDWIKTGDFDQLANLLKEDRSAIASPGERGMVMLIASDRRQARVLKRYVSGLLNASPMLGGLIATRRPKGPN